MKADEMDLRWLIYEAFVAHTWRESLFGVSGYLIYLALSIYG